MSESATEAIRLKSLIFWLDMYARVDELSMLKRYWKARDFEGYKKGGVCPYCKGSPAFDLTQAQAPVVLHGIHIERVQCYCLTLKSISTTASQWYESYYSNSFLSDINPVDVPSGAAARTRSIVGKLEKFMSNPTRSALINGNPGCGKSHMLQALKTHFGGFATYITFADFFQKLHQYREEANGKLQRFIEALTYAPILLMDDFGLQHSTDWSTNTIAGIIDNRYARKRLAPTIMTTNLTLVEMQRTEGVSIGNMERILSRMMDSENSTVMSMLQEDYRSKKFKKEAGI